MQHVAFFRNVNQGQRGHVTRDQLLRAVLEAGATDAHAFQSNGTVVFGSDRPDAVADALRSWAERRERSAGAVFVLDLPLLTDLVLAQERSPQFDRLELTVFGATRLPPDDDPGWVEARRRRCEIVDHGPGWATVLNHRDRQSNGTPTIEAVLDRPATSRGLPTLLRLIDRHGDRSS